MTWEQWLIFVSIWALAGIPLGPNALNCIALSAGAGFKRSLWSVAGILVAALCHKTAVILGAAAILLANAELFSLLKLCGAAYLIWMGISLWRKGGQLPATATPKATSRVQIVRQAFVVSMSNPKAILSYLAVFSQFLTPGEPLAPQLIVLVPTALSITAAIYVSYCALGTGIGRFLGTLRRRLIFNRSVGSFYICAGAALGRLRHAGHLRKPVEARPSHSGHECPFGVSCRGRCRR
jgi:homoserine/homoserine lactone efflux protein